MNPTFSFSPPLSGYYPAQVKIVVSHGGTGARGSGFLRAPVPLCEKNLTITHKIKFGRGFPFRYIKNLIRTDAGIIMKSVSGI